MINWLWLIPVFIWGMVVGAVAQGEMPPRVVEHIEETPIVEIMRAVDEVCEGKVKSFKVDETGRPDFECFLGEVK